MRIRKAIAVPTLGGYYNEDLAAIRNGVEADGLFYLDPPQSPGFRSIRQPSEACSILFVLDDQRVVFGDALCVDYAAAGGRDGIFIAAEQVPLIETICAELDDRPIGGFVEMCEELEDTVDKRGLHQAAAMFGFSQAILHAVAASRGVTCAEVIADEFDTNLSRQPIPLGIQSGEHRREAVDKAIMRNVGVLPHGLINNLETMGNNGRILLDYVNWIVERLDQHGAPGYQPLIHLDLYGQLGATFDHDLVAMTKFLCELEQCAKPFQLCIETPLLMENAEQQRDRLRSLHDALQQMESTVRLIVDEWANNLDEIRSYLVEPVVPIVHVKAPDLGSLHRAVQAVLECRAASVSPILGGSCAETDQSARTVAHVALATAPEWVLARPGMGVDEGVQIMHNEMARTIALIEARGEKR